MMSPDFVQPYLITWLFLAASILFALARNNTWLALLGITLISGYYFKQLDIIALAITGLGLGIAYTSRLIKNRLFKWLTHLFIVIWLMALSLHLLPGFNNLLVLDQVRSGSNSQVFTMNLNLDKPMLIFALILLTPTMLHKSEFDWRYVTLTPKQLATISFSMIVMFALGYSTQLIAPEVSIPDWWWLFAFNNLLLTCVAEELFFRGYIQKQLSEKFSPLIGIGIASVLFGIAHFSGGLAFVLIATLAGVIYGLSYYWTKHITVAIAVHFIFNMFHLTLFTYPLMR